ncbi:MAG: rRNA maturation RNase YbeY [Fusobacteria bacterium]|nr:rRNA maturation RNase YbeY [Fusobacteriota bacterium]
MEIIIDLTNENSKFDLDLDKIESFIHYVIKKEYDSEKDVYISVLISDNDEIQNINREYRGKDMPTDVISFAYNETENEGIYDVLGDIIISFDKVQEQSKEYEHSIEREFFYVLLHGMLHLLGYDHIEDEDKKIMREKEEQILEKYNIRRE